jgi:hypothetical protein
MMPKGELTKQQCVDCPGVPHRGHTDMTEQQPELINRGELVGVFNSVLPIDGNANYLIDRLMRDYDISSRKDNDVER